jgi:hypothetical protein
MSGAGERHGCAELLNSFSYTFLLYQHATHYLGKVVRERGGGVADKCQSAIAGRPRRQRPGELHDSLAQQILPCKDALLSSSSAHASSRRMAYRGQMQA